MIGAARARTLAAAFALCALAACGKKGPPLPPLHIVPEPPAEMSARRVSDQVELRFVLPTKNANGPGAVNLDRVEVFATTVAAGAAAPPNREFLSPKYRVAVIPVRPAEPEEAPTTPAQPDTRPGPGEVARFTETLDEAKLRPVFTKPAEEPKAVPSAGTAAAPPAATAAPTGSGASPSAAGAAAQAGATAAAEPGAAGAARQTATAAAEPAVAARVYAVRGIARNGRPGAPSARLMLPLVPAPAPPGNAKVTFDEKAVTVSWLPPVLEGEGAKLPGFNVYRPDAPVPLNDTPLEATSFETSGVEYGKESCFLVRSVLRSGAVSVESAATEPVCVTPQDIFPPAAPERLTAVASDGAVNLIWDASPDADVAGYLVLRAEAPNDTLQAITTEPVQATTYRDTAVKPGVRYVYAVVAVDKATPPNMSAQSRRAEEIVR